MALSVNLAKLISTTTKTHPQFRGISPRWLLKLMPYVQVQAGVYRVNRVEQDPVVIGGHEAGEHIPVSFAGYDDKPQEYTLSSIEAVLNMHSRVLDVYNDPYDQLQEQLATIVQVLKETQEYHVVNNPKFGLLHSASPDMIIEPEVGAPTPNDMDNLISMVWKNPAFFLAHPKVIAKFGHECTKRGVCIGAVEIMGNAFQTWRGIPIVPCDKVQISKEGKSDILLMRVGAEAQGVVGLHHAGVINEIMPSISARLKGIDDKGIASYLLTLYHSVAVHTEDALAILKNVQL